MRHNNRRVKKFNNQRCYYSHVTDQIFTETVLNTFNETTKQNLGTLENFDSLLEARVYSTLKTFEKTTNGCNSTIKVHVTRQVSIEVKPSTMLFPAIIYKADFRVDLIDATDMLKILPIFIEAKGLETPEYRLKMKFLEYYDLETFLSITQVTDTRNPNSVVSSILLTDLPEFCITLIETFFDLRKQCPKITEIGNEIIAMIIDKASNADNN
jgi:hypothetical protein